MTAPKAQVLQINWHERKAIYSIHFQPLSDLNLQDSFRFATSGADTNVRVYLYIILAIDLAP